MAAVVRRHSDAIGYDAFRVPGLLLEAWVAERRKDSAAAVEAYRGALELAGRVGFGDHAAFALAGLGSDALARGDLGEAEELLRQALAPAEAARAPWVVAHARVQLGRNAAAAGDADGAERLYREVLDWSPTQRPHQARESLFLALAGSPAAAALARSRGARRGPRRHRRGRRPPRARRPSAHLSWQNRRHAWQSVGIGGREPSCCPRQTEQEARLEHHHDR